MVRKRAAAGRRRGRTAGPALLLVAVCALCSATAAPAGAAEAHASLGATAAQLTWTPDENDFFASDIRLSVERGGVDALTAAPVVASSFAVLDMKLAPAPVRVVDLDGDGEPEVVVSLFSGGASCCFGARVYRFADGTYEGSELLALGGGYRLAPLGGGPPLFSTAAEFWRSGAHACAGYPLELFAYRRGRFADVTPRHPRQLRHDARAWGRRWRGRCEDRPAVDFLAAYVVDQRRLGRGRAAERAIAQARRRGYFGTDRSIGQMTESEFRRTLRRFVASLGPHALPGAS